jgi:hypothetical protein
MCSVPVVGPWEAGGAFTVPGPEGSCVGEAKEQWLSALMSITAVSQEQQDGQEVCTQLHSHSGKGAGPQGATLKAQRGSASGLDCFAHPANSSSAQSPTFTQTGTGWGL